MERSWIPSHDFRPSHIVCCMISFLRDPCQLLFPYYMSATYVACQFWQRMHRTYADLFDFMVGIGETLLRCRTLPMTMRLHFDTYFAGVCTLWGKRIALGILFKTNRSTRQDSGNSQTSGTVYKYRQETQCLFDMQLSFL